MERKIETQVKGFHAIDGGGVHLVRVLGNTTVKAFNPFLMLDSFDSTNPEDYVAGFPMRHRDHHLRGSWEHAAQGQHGL